MYITTDFCVDSSTLCLGLSHSAGRGMKFDRNDSRSSPDHKWSTCLSPMSWSDCGGQWRRCAYIYRNDQWLETTRRENTRTITRYHVIESQVFRLYLKKEMKRSKETIGVIDHSGVLTLKFSLTSSQASNDGLIDILIETIQTGSSLGPH